MSVLKLRLALALSMVASSLLLSGCGALSFDRIFGDEPPPLAGPLDPTAREGIEYDVEITGLDPEDPAQASLEALIEDAARVYRLKDRDPASIAMLRRRAQSDQEIVMRALKSEGYYKGEAEITVVEREAALDGTEAEESARLPLVVIHIDPGPRFEVAAHGYKFDPDPNPPLLQRTLEAGQSDVDQPARGAEIVAAEENALAMLNENGRPYAEKTDRQATANFDDNTVSTVTDISSGPFTIYGPLAVKGAKRVENDYIASFSEWRQGEPVALSDLRNAQSELSGTRLFKAVSVKLPPEPENDDDPYVAPVVIEVEEAKHRSIGGGASYSTSDGPGVSGFWEHRNFWGRGELLRGDLDIALERQEVALTFRKPRFTDPDRSLAAKLNGFHENTDAFDAFGLTASLLLEEQFNDYLRGTAGLSLEASQITRGGVKAQSYLIGAPVTLAFDTSDDLLDPTEGVRAQILVTPWGGAFDDEPVGFVVVDSNASTYIALDEEKRYIFAARARAAFIGAEDIDAVPPRKRLYAGGGGSVRGYRSQFVGPLDNNDTPIGGLTAAELGAEMRIRYGSFGVVPFVEGGLVGDEAFSGFEEFLYSAGLGLRYYSPVGPIRLDVAVPLNKRDADDDFQVYFSIGQAF